MDKGIKKATKAKRKKDRMKALSQMGNKARKEIVAEYLESSGTPDSSSDYVPTPQKRAIEKSTTPGWYKLFCIFQTINHNKVQLSTI